jgi:hypothetical protein
MKHLLIAINLLVLAVSTPAIAGQAEYDDCILEHLKDAKLDDATRLIKQACYENYKDTSFTSDKMRSYNNCLLEHLVGVESISAVMEIKTACSRKHE